MSSEWPKANRRATERAQSEIKLRVARRIVRGGPIPPTDESLGQTLAAIGRIEQALKNWPKP